MVGLVTIGLPPKFVTNIDLTKFTKYNINKRYKRARSNRAWDRLEDWDDFQGQRLNNARGWDWTGDWNVENFPRIDNPYNLPPLTDYERVFYLIYYWFMTLHEHVSDNFYSSDMTEWYNLIPLRRRYSFDDFNRFWITEKNFVIKTNVIFRRRRYVE